MALKVAELFAELGVDASQLDKGVDKAVVTASRSMRDVVDAAEKAGLDAGEGLADGVAQGTAGLGSDVEQQLRTETSGLDSAAQRIGTDAGDELAQGVERGAQGIGADVEQRFRSETSGLGEVGRRAGEDAGGGIGGGILDGIPDLSGGIGGVLDDALGSLPSGLAGPAGAAGAAIGVALMAGFSDAIDNEAQTDVLTNRLSRFGAESGEVAAVSSGLFRDAWGDSTADVNAAIDSVYSTLADSRESRESLEEITAAAISLADVLGIDVADAVAAAGVLISNGLAKDSMEAFDQITAAAKSVPAAIRDDLLDVLTEGEYVQAFETLGYSGEEAFGTLVAAAKEGTFQLDKTGDSVTEFARLNQDMSNDTVAAYETIGLSADDYQAKIMQGGPVARQAFLEVVAALQQVEDPAERARAAIGLFGTPLSDIANDSAQLNEILGYMASDALPGVAGSAADTAEAFDNTAGSITVVKRELQGLFEDYANRKLTPLADLVQTDDPGLEDAGSAAASTVWSGFTDYLKLAVLGAPGILLSWLDGDDVEDDARAAGEAAGTAFREGLTAAQLAQQGGEATGFVGGDPGLRLNPETGELVPDQEFKITADGVQAIATLEDVNREIELSNELFALAGDRADNYLQRIGNTANIDDQIASQLALRDSSGALFDSLAALDGVDIGAFASGAEQVSDEAAAALGNISGAASAAQQQIADTLEWDGEGAALEKAGQLRDEFVKMFDAAGMTDQQIIDLLASMGLLPEQVTTAIELSGADEALAKLDLLQTRFDEEIPDVVQTQIDVAVAEGRFVDAANLISIWVKDQEDGSISDPLLIAMGLGDTEPASGEVEGWKRSEEGKPPATIPISANTGPARGAAAELFWDIQRLHPTIPVDIVANYVNFAQDFPLFGPKRAGGGPITGPGGPTDDKVLTPTSNGEWVINAAAVDELGPEAMARINQGELPAVLVPVAMEASAGGGSSVPGLDVLAAEVRSLAAAAARARDVTIHAPMTTTASPEENLRMLELRAEQGMTMSGAR